MPRLHDEDLPVGTLLIHVSRLFREIARSRLTEIGLHRGQAFVLLRLAYHDGSPQHLLAQGVHIRPATLTPMLQKLEEMGWITRKTDRRDRRITRVYLTEAGHTKRREAEAVFNAMEIELDKLYTPSEREHFRQYLLAARQGLQGNRPAHAEPCRHGPFACDALPHSRETI
ncbi:winged helix-turn-helix transcriptional regulator [Candidatus Bipolaricaulota bacterium]|nr:winged helix-turn-helix transcriptional regulator [Candidatus Bipolaricaulota bacterium]